MNNDFSTWYLALLRKQVEDEIQFLVTNGHNEEWIRTPCMFCTEAHPGRFRCRRLKDLREFQSSIMSNIRSTVKNPRRQIGLTPSEELESHVDSISKQPIFQMK